MLERRISENCSQFKIGLHRLSHENEKTTKSPQHDLFALAACGISNPLQEVHDRVQVYSWHCSGIYRRDVYSTLFCQQTLSASIVRSELVVPLAKKVTLERLSFSCEAPSLWDALPQDIRDVSLSLNQFQSKLTTFLYREVYNL